MTAGGLASGLRLAIGTLTAIPVPAPTTVDGRTARTAVLLAPVAAVPLGLAVAAALAITDHFGSSPLTSGFVALGVLLLGTRAFHIDGLADTADGLTASYDPERSLAVMKSGSVGPAGTAAVVVVIGLQAIGLATLASDALAAGVIVCLSRASLALACMSGVPAAEGDGLRTPFAESLSAKTGFIYWAAATAIGTLSMAALGLPWRHTLAGFGIATMAVAFVLRRATTRLGGITGDIFGAVIELTLAALLVVM